MNNLKGKLTIPVKYPELQSKTVNPSDEVQVVIPDDNYYGLSKVTVNPVQHAGYELELTGSTLEFIKGASIEGGEIVL